MKFTMTKSVQFSPYSELKFIPYLSREEKDKMWYTKEDNEGFKYQMMGDAAQCSITLARMQIESGHGYEQLSEFLISCIGLEHLVSKHMGIVQSAKVDVVKKKAHARIVLAEHKRQKTCNVYSPLELARVSRESSLMSGEKINKVGNTKFKCMASLK
jgi:nickel-dependent lactate racemase